MIKFINKITDGTHMSESGFHFAAPCAYDFDPAVKAKLDAISINRFDREVDNLWDGFESIWEADDGKFYAVLSVFIGDGCEPAIWAEVVKSSYCRADVAVMVEDFLADHADEYADDPIVLEGEPVYDKDCCEYVQPCHDSNGDYLLVPHANGEVTIESV